MTAAVQNMKKIARHLEWRAEMALRSMLALVREFQKQLAALEKVISELSDTLSEVQLLESIPGVGTKLATAIVSEIEDASQIHHPKQLVA